MARSLYKASKHGQENVTSLLLNLVSDPTAIGRALHIATVRNHANVVSIVLDKFPSVNARRALYNASELGYTSVVHTLLNKTAGLQCHNYQTAVQIASIYNYIDIVYLIRDHIIRSNDIFAMVLINAAWGGYKTIVKCFLDKCFLDKLDDRDLLTYIALCFPEEVLPLILERLTISNVASMLLRRNSRQESFYHCVSAYLKDLKPNLILSTEGREIKVHKEVISYWSSYFQAAIRFEDRACSEDRDNYKFDPGIISFCALKAIVDFCYSGICNDFGSCGLTQAADYLGINLIMASCNRYDLRSGNISLGKE